MISVGIKYFMHDVICDVCLKVHRMPWCG